MEPLIADLGWILHWSLADIERLTIPELGRYHALAIERAKAGHGRA